MQIEELVDNFSFLDDWEDRYRYLIELGRGLAPLSDDERNPSTKVRGCASQVWLISHAKGHGPDAILDFRGDSDAHIVRGLIAVLFALYSGRKASDILATDERAVFRQAGAQRPSDAAALERSCVHGGADQRTTRFPLPALRRQPHCSDIPISGIRACYLKEL